MFGNQKCPSNVFGVSKKERHGSKKNLLMVFPTAINKSLPKEPPKGVLYEK